MTNPSGGSAKSYLLALIPLALGAAICGWAVSGLLAEIERMPRVVVPGGGKVTLAAGDYIAFGESDSRVGDTVYRSGSFEVRCGMRSVEAGDQVALSKPSVHTSYSAPGFHGESLFELTIPRDGAYELRCEGSGGPTTIALGHCIGTSLVLLVVGVFGGVGGAILTLAVVRRRRRRARVAAELTALPEARVV